MKMVSLTRAARVALTGLFVLGAIAAAIIACSTKGDKEMGLTDDEIVVNTAIPAIDMVTPERTETATFALG